MKTTFAFLLLAPLICIGKDLAVSDTSAWWTHYTYMFGHAGWLHYCMNGLGWFLMRPIHTPCRTLTAIVIASLIPATATPTLGWSVVLYYYMGLCLASMKTGDKVRMLLLIFVGFFIPWIAAQHHAVMLLSGWLVRKVERRWERTM